VARVVVVGAGMAGLATAARLATLGHDVVICEQSSTWGGKLGTLRREGFTFDTGPSLLTLPAVYRDLFVKTGKPLEDSVELVQVDPVTRYRFPAVEGHDVTWLDLPNASRPRLHRALDETLGAGAGADWDRFLDRAHAIWQVTRGPILESPHAGGRDLLRLARRTSDVRTVAPWQTLRGLGRSYLGDPRLRMFLDRYATYTGSDPRRAPAALSVVPYVEQTFGAWYVPGGLRRLGEAVLERAELRGARLRTGAAVAEVVVEAGRATGVRLADGEPLGADVVIANADAAHLYDDLLPHSVAGTARRRLHRATPSLSGFVLLLALRGRTPGLAHHTVLFPDDQAVYDEEFDSVFGSRGHEARPVDDPTVYVSAPDDPALRPDDDHEGLFVLVNAARHGHGPDSLDWDAPGLATSYADRVLDVMAERGLDVRDRVLWREVRTPADLERATRSPGGAIYGTSSNGARAAFLRPANASPVAGLFLVGGSAHPGGGLPLVGLSAAIVAGLVGPA
jgi:phytoene desaturase